MNTIYSSNYPIGRWALWRQDVLMVFAFFVWAVVLGFVTSLGFQRADINLSWLRA
jgi:hypothetical protein